MNVDLERPDGRLDGSARALDQGLGRPAGDGHGLGPAAEHPAGAPAAEVEIFKWELDPIVSSIVCIEKPIVPS